MTNLQVLFVIAITFNIALGMSFRHTRQTEDNENNLEDRYGWDRPQGPSWNSRPWQQRPNQGQQRPNQGQQRPNQGQQWNELPNQGGNQLPNQGGGRPLPNQNGQNNGNGQNQNQPTPSPNGNGSTTQLPAVQECMRLCPVTAEYNPVCGTNLVQYPNPGRLVCAQNCGVNVSLLRSSPCPATTTAAPLS